MIYFIDIVSYSSLEYIETLSYFFPFDRLDIDFSFVPKLCVQTLNKNSITIKSA